MSTFKNKNSLRTIEAQIVQKHKNEAQPKFTGSYKKKASNRLPLYNKFVFNPPENDISRLHFKK